MLEVSEGKVQCKTARMLTWLTLHQALRPVMTAVIVLPLDVC